MQEKDGNTKVSLNFKLVDRKNGETIEKTLSFVINTPPYIFQGEPVFGSLGTQAVLCLNFAKYSDNPSIWNDFCTQENGKTVFVIKINNENYKFELNKSNDTISYIGSNNSGTLLTENLNSIVFNTGIFTQNSNSIYFAFNPDISSFTVIAEDSAGLKVEYKINSSSFEKILYVANVPKSSNHSGSIKDPANLQNALDFLKGKNGEWTIRIMEDLIQNSTNSPFASIDLSTNSDYPSTITIEGYNGIKIIDGNNKNSIFKFVGLSSIPDFTVILKNLIMQKGKQNTDPGSGIYCYYMNLKMYNCEVKNNVADYQGGGLYLSKSSLELNNCKINNNSSFSQNGGGIFSLNSSLIISNTEINNNIGSLTGGGIHYEISDNNTYISRLTNCTISKNTVSEGWSYGGGLYLIDRNHSLNNKFYCTNCSININSSKNRGAGFYVDSIKLILSTCSIKNNSVNGELSIAGAGIWCTSLNCLQYTSDTQIKNNSPDNVYVEN